jgi:hypothetical protein
MTQNNPLWDTVEPILCDIMPFEWKKAAVIGVSFGAAAAITLLVVGGFGYWLFNREKGMNSTAIKAVSSTAWQTSDLDATKRTMTPNGFELYFVLANTTSHDYTLPEDVKLFNRDAKTDALTEFYGKPDHAFLIPAKDKAEIRIHADYGCSDENIDTGVTKQRDPQTCYNDNLGEVKGFLALDYKNQIRIELPKPTLHATPANPPVQGKDLPPDKGDVFDRVAACDRAEHLTTSCKAKNISVGKDNPAYYDGWQDPLPLLPVPPNSYELDPSPQVCGIVYQWRNFCRAQK